MPNQISPIDNTGFAVAVAAEGQALVLAASDPTDPAQLWTFETRTVLGITGTAFRNVKTGLFAAFNGAGLPLVARSVERGENWMIVWSTIGVSGGDRFAFPPNTDWTWNVDDNQFAAGTPILAWNDAQSNSIFRYAPVATFPAL